MKVYSREPFLKKTDRVLLVLCLFGLLITGAVLNSDKLFQRLFGSGESAATTPQIGWISSYDNDTRHKSFGSLAWEKARTHEAIHIGDSVFTAPNSSATVTLKNHNRVELDQNSMITFRTIDNIEVPDFALGNFRLNVSGSLRVSIAGHVRELQGNNGEVQIYIHRGHPMIRALKGRVLIGDMRGFKNLATETLRDVEPDDANEDAIPKLSAAPYVHIWQVADLYKPAAAKPAPLVVGASIQPRVVPQLWVNLSANVSWIPVGSPKKVYGELSADPRFSIIKDTFAADGRSLHANFHTAYIGDNYVHLSVDHRHWSATQSFRVVGQYIDRPPQTYIPNAYVYLLNNSAESTLQVASPASVHSSGPAPVQSFIIEITKDANFSPAQTRAVWLTADVSGHAHLSFQVHQPGIYYFRARGVNRENQISAASTVARVVVERPMLPDAPLLSSSEIHMTEGETRDLTWPSAARANRYSVRIVNVVNGSSTTLALNNPALRLSPQKPGIYNLQIASVDEFHRRSNTRATVRLIVSPRPTVISPVPREPAQDQSLIMTYSKGNPNEWGSNINRSNIDVELGEFSMYSRDLATAGGQTPTAAFVGVHWLDWFGANGFEGRAFSKVADVSVPANSGVSPMDIEARYERRWQPIINLFSFFEPLQLAVISGVELYRNFTSGYYSPGYTVAKIGASAAIPIAHRWSTGGEFLYGYNPDSTQLYETSIYGNYFYKKNWSLGLGYRMQLLDAGSAAEAPGQLPYREGASEAYTELRWYY